MFFKGLLRYIGTVDITDYAHDCHKIIHTSDQSIYHFSKIKEFNDSAWALHEISYDSAKRYNRYVPPSFAYKKIVNTVLDQISKNGQQYYVVSSMLAWLLPGQKIDKHVDLQKVYAQTRRIHVQITQDTGAYMSVWSGNHEHKCTFDPGFVYELNNRAYHSVTHNGLKEIYSILVIDFGAVNNTFVKEDNIEKDTNIPESKNLPLWI